ncbi:hypothetical protein [Saccharibacillus alkalitolerans]|uniref:Uncharacterized protein n=1 Tax=Saccharibacillus alkalitolerans TaxID=2705290 RepID=A0ABX0F2I0_9BACL|nr:hypothetical protein [Saccharibacillus alkalitolerans]NGZ74070.1 hypothetical protein [Saccharibacillus alkalitolerans]
MKESRERFAIAIVMAALALTFYDHPWLFGWIGFVSVYALVSGFVYRKRVRKDGI